MVTLYGIVSDIDNAMIITLLSIALVCVVFLMRIWKIAGLTGRRFTTWEWFHIYLFSIIIFICGVVSFAKFLYPENADKLLNLLHIDGLIMFLTRGYQAILIKLILTIMNIFK